MATSGTYTFTVTRDDIIYAALRAIGAIDATNTADPAEVTSAALELNMILKQWAQEGAPVWAIQTVPVALQTNKISYTVGIGGDVNLSYRPPRVISAYLHNNQANTDISILPISKQEYEALGSKTSQSVVNQYYYDQQIPLCVLYVYGAPFDSTSYSLFITVQRPLQDVTASTDNFDVPQDFFQALKWELAHQLCYAYGTRLELMDRIKMEADVAKEKAFSFDQEDVSVYFQVDPRTYYASR